MKKLYNKALMYQYFYIGKWALLLCCLFLGFVSYESIGNNLRSIESSISMLRDNRYIVQNYDIRLISWGLLLLMYIIITGINKRNNMTFLTSGPYTKSEIKKNEILFLFISLCAFVAVFCYISLCLYYKNIDLINLSYGYMRESLKEVVKLFICGLAFIAYLSIMDSLFANIGITVLIMITTPFIIFFDIMFLQTVLERFSCTILYQNKIAENIFNVIESIIDFAFGSVNYSNYSTNLVIATILILTIALFILTKFTVKKLAINNTNKLFNFPIVEKIFLWCFSLSITLLGSCIILDMYYPRYGGNFNEGATFSFRGIVYIFVLISASYVIRRISGKQLKKVI